VWDQIKNQTPEVSSSSEVEDDTGPEVRRTKSGLLELEPRSEESREWGGEVVSEEEGSEVRSERRFRRRVNRTLVELRTEIALLREQVEMSRGRRRHTREGIPATLGKWTACILGVLLTWAALTSFCGDMHCLTELLR
jgi:hypothetical protein